MPLSERENYLRTVLMNPENLPEWMPCRISISAASRQEFGGAGEDLMARYSDCFPGFQRGAWDYNNPEYRARARAGETYEDNWGCVWESEVDGIVGIVSGHPLADWDALDEYSPPDPMTQSDYGERDWEAEQERVKQARKHGKLTTGGVEHGFFFMRMYYLRGFENLMMDFATNDLHLDELIDMLLDYNRQVVRQWLDMDVDIINFGEDLGAQQASVMGPKFFTKHIAPAYEELFGMCHEAGTLTALHSDGHIMDIIDELLATGCDVINPQDLCNGIENLHARVKGRACIRLDVDRQSIVPFGEPDEIHDLIEREVKSLGAPEGGLELICGIYPPTPLENVKAVCEAMEEFRGYWW